MTTFNQGLNRRRFLISTTAAVAATAVAGSIVSGCGNTVSTPPGPQTTGLTVADLAVGMFVTPAGADYIVARDDQGLYAYSNVCTHQGCSVPKPTTAGVSTCPCHLAQFDANGNNIAGPHGGAPIGDLEHYAVTFNGTGSTAQIVVDTASPLSDRATRAQPPA